MCGLFYAAAYTTITPGTGNGQEMNGITGVIIGGTSMSGGSGTMVGTLIGVFIMSVLKNGLSSCGLQAPWQTFLTGVSRHRRGPARYRKNEGRQPRQEGLKPNIRNLYPARKACLIK